MSIMKISITGHTKGLGKELTTRFDYVKLYSFIALYNRIAFLWLLGDVLADSYTLLAV